MARRSLLDMSARRLLGRDGAMALVCAVGVWLAASSPSRANHIAGAAYSGTHSGGGTVELMLTPDGSQVASWNITNIPGNVCSFSNWGVMWGPGFGPPISNHAFDYTATSGMGAGSFFRGSFPGPQAATGTFLRRFASPGAPTCESQTLTWNATTSAPPPGPPPPGPPGPSPPGPQPPGPPPGPQVDIAAPLLRLSGPRSQSVARQRGVYVTATCVNENCSSSASGSVSVRGASRAYRLKRTRASLTRGQPRRVALAFRRGALPAIRRALARGAKVKATVTVTARDAAGNETTRKRIVRLTR